MNATALWVEFALPEVVEQPKTSVGTLVKTPVKVPAEILRCLAANPSMTLAEVAVEIQKSLSAVERASARLVKDGKLKHDGPQMDGYWEVLK